MGFSASRPATIEPSDAATAPTSDIEKQTTVRGRRTRRQSTGARPAGTPDGVAGPGLESPFETCASCCPCVVVVTITERYRRPPTARLSFWSGARHTSA
ncbi:hypothetical protein GCM10023258_30710 [Terrabacter aeriphilus]|uniref:Uncharacterized protein n=1 Tax=Terrabacter aeriphilus TaxID=515662 RepID=A0ABP9JHR6_9MICO